MHDEAYSYVERAVAELGPFSRVVEFGSLDVNGSVRPIFVGATRYVGVDQHPGPCVDVVADASTWTTDERFDCAVCCEVLEHARWWPNILLTAWLVLDPTGVLIVTCAGPGRGPHSQFDGNALRDGEHYENIDPAHLAKVLDGCGFDIVDVDQTGLDVRAVGRRP